MKYTENSILKNGRECLIRNAVEDDAQEVLDVFLLTHAQTDFLVSYSDESTLDTEFEKKFLTDAENSERDVYLCAVLDGHIVGTACVFKMGESKYAHRASLGIAIDRKFWGLGIGRKLTEACIECAKTAGYDQLELEVVKENETAIALYKKMGFMEYGRNPRGLSSRYTGWQELIYMLLELN